MSDKRNIGNVLPKDEINVIMKSMNGIQLKIVAKI